MHKVIICNKPEERGGRIANYYREHISGTKLERPELSRLLSDSQQGDILLVEQIDRLTRLNNTDWLKLKTNRAT